MFKYLWTNAGIVLQGDGADWVTIPWEFVESVGAKLIQEKAFYEAAKLERYKYGTNEDR